MDETPTRIDLATAALLVVDVQRGFVTPATEQVVAPIVDLAAAWQRAGGLVLCTRFVNRPGSQWERLLDWAELCELPSIELEPRLQPFADPAHTFDKHRYGALTGELRAVLAEHGVTTLVICGIDTDGCVLASAIAAFDAGFRPLVVADCCASSGGPALHEAGLLLLRRLLGRRQLVPSAGSLRLGRG